MANKTLISLLPTVLILNNCVQPDEKSTKPNFIVILADDLGYGDIGAYRALYKGGDDNSIACKFTTELDRLANQGIICTRAYSGSWCAPSRQMLLSGCWVNRKDVYDPSFPWIGRRLRQAGYVTGMYGKSHGADAIFRTVNYLDVENAEFDQGLFFPGGARGYHPDSGEILPGHNYGEDASFRAAGNEYITDVFTNGAVDFIETNAGKPFMLYLSYTAPHEPLEGKPEDLKTLFPEVFANLSDSSLKVNKKPPEISLYDWRKYNYAALVYAVDRGIGKIRKVLKENAIDKNTLIIFTSDNGAQWGSNYPFTGHKWDVYEGGIRVPFIVWSDKIQKSTAGGKVYDGLVSLADIAPTLCVMAGINAEQDFDGMNIMPNIIGEGTQQENMFFYREALQHGQVSGADTLYPGGTERILLEAFILERKKYLHFGGLYHEKVYEKGFALPNVAGVSEPQIKMAESMMKTIPNSLTEIPMEASEALRQKRDIFILENNDNFTLRWSGHYSSEQLKGGEHSER